MDIFSNEEQKAIKDLIELYEKFIVNSKDKSLYGLAEKCEWYIGPAYSHEVISAVSNIKFTLDKIIKISNAEPTLKILKSLQNK